MSEPITIPIHTEYITLGQMLKLADVISFGGEAKAFLAEYSVFVNGEQDQRRGRKLYPGDSITVHPGGDPIEVRIVARATGSA
jgi:ribosome-associated protein